MVEDIGSTYLEQKANMTILCFMLVRAASLNQQSTLPPFLSE